MTERSENEVKTASDHNDEGKLHNKERDGFKERVFAWPDAICGGYIKNDTCIGKFSMVFIYICDHFFPLKPGFLSKFTPCTPPLGPPDMARNWGRKEKENKTRSSVKECIFIGKLFWLSALIRVSFCSLGFCFRQLLSSWNQNQMIVSDFAVTQSSVSLDVFIHPHIS